MTPAEIIAQVKPCDMEKPYIFISYSAQDHERVWEDVLMFQQLGYNIWLDEKNLDKTKESWKDDALNAIYDPECQLVVFYVSGSSLLSRNCLDELLMTTSEDTVLIHLTPVPFIAIDVVNVGNIGEFTKAIHTDLMRSKLPKQEKIDKAKVLGIYSTTFFNSNNERVRVHPKDEPNRKVDYYSEIVECLPDSARVFPPIIELPSKKAAEEARKKAAEEAQRKAEEEAKRKAEEEAKRKAEEEAKRKAEEDAKRKAEEDAKRKAEEDAKRKAEADQVDYALADQIAALLSRSTDLLGETPPPADPPAEEPTKTPSLEELIRMQMGEG